MDPKPKHPSAVRDAGWRWQRWRGEGGAHVVVATVEQQLARVGHDVVAAYDAACLGVGLEQQHVRVAVRDLAAQREPVRAAKVRAPGADAAVEEAAQRGGGVGAVDALARRQLDHARHARIDLAQVLAARRHAPAERHGVADDTCESRGFGADLKAPFLVP